MAGVSASRAATSSQPAAMPHVVELVELGRLERQRDVAVGQRDLARRRRRCGGAAGAPARAGVTPSIATTVRSHSQSQSFVSSSRCSQVISSTVPRSPSSSVALDGGVHALTVAGVEERRALQRDGVRRDRRRERLARLAAGASSPACRARRRADRSRAPGRPALDGGGARGSPRPRAEAPPAQHLGRIVAHRRAAAARVTEWRGRPGRRGRGARGAYVTK